LCRLGDGIVRITLAKGTGWRGGGDAPGLLAVIFMPTDAGGLAAHLPCIADLPLVDAAPSDFNQRLTTWGVRSLDELRWVFPDLELREVTVSHRQSRRLNDLTREIILAVGGTQQIVSLPAQVDSEGFPSVLMEAAADTDFLVNWLADRLASQLYCHRHISECWFGSGYSV
jgi:hypothetical protein